MSAPIPAVWRVDVEPDQHQPTRESGSWEGLTAMVELVERLRPRLGERSGAELHPTWMLRLDPEIERVFGSTDFVAERHGGIFDRLRRHGDSLGIHVHAHRWDERRRCVYSDYADEAWVVRCLEVAAEAFARRFGEPARRSSQGGYLLSEACVDAAVRLGIEVDLTAEPGRAPRSRDASFGDYATAPSTDFRGYPRRPYYPSRRAAGRPAESADDARALLIVPLTAYDFRSALAPLHRRIADRLRGRSRRHLPLSPFKSWPSPRFYWNLVARAVEEQPAQYLCIAVRTDGPASEAHRRARELLEGLGEHPISQRLRFVDPLAPEIRALAGQV